MEKLIRFVLCIAFMVSCNVFQMVKQDDGKIPDDFFLTDTIPYPNNMLAKSYMDVKNYLGIIDNAVPVSFALSKNKASFAPVSFGTEWDSDLIFSDNNSNSMTARSWVSHTIRNIEIEYTNGNKYESPTNRLLRSLNNLCAGSLILADNGLSLSEFDIPAPGTYETIMSPKAIYALAQYCGINDVTGMEGQPVSMTLSAPTSNLIYDLRIDFMGSVYYLRYTSQGMAIAGVESYDGGQGFQKVLINNDLVSNGLAIEFIEGPTNTTVDDNNTHIGMKIYYDTTSARTGLFGILYKEVYDTATDNIIDLFLGGYIGSGGNLSLSMRGTNFSDSASERVACISPASWAIQTDNSMCSASTTTVAGINTDSSANSSMENFFNNWSSSFSAYSSVTDADFPGFSTIGNMGTSDFFGTGAK